ncbi:unnamed protein product [Closterium sp. NIES-54]
MRLYCLHLLQSNAMLSLPFSPHGHALLPPSADSLKVTPLHAARCPHCDCSAAVRCTPRSRCVLCCCCKLSPRGWVFKGYLFVARSFDLSLFLCVFCLFLHLPSDFSMHWHSFFPLASPLLPSAGCLYGASSSHTRISRGGDVGNEGSEGSGEGRKAGVHRVGSGQISGWSEDEEGEGESHGGEGKGVGAAGSDGPAVSVVIVGYKASVPSLRALILVESMAVHVAVHVSQQCWLLRPPPPSLPPPPLPPPPVDLKGRSRGDRGVRGVGVGGGTGGAGGAGDLILTGVMGGVGSRRQGRGISLCPLSPRSQAPQVQSAQVHVPQVPAVQGRAAASAVVAAQQRAARAAAGSVLQWSMKVNVDEFAQPSLPSKLQEQQDEEEDEEQQDEEEKDKMLMESVNGRHTAMQHMLQGQLSAVQHVVTLWGDGALLLALFALAASKDLAPFPKTYTGYNHANKHSRKVEGVPVLPATIHEDGEHNKQAENSPAMAEMEVQNDRVADANPAASVNPIAVDKSFTIPEPFKGWTTTTVRGFRTDFKALLKAKLKLKKMKSLNNQGVILHSIRTKAVEFQTKYPTTRETSTASVASVHFENQKRIQVEFIASKELEVEEILSASSSHLTTLATKLEDYIQGLTADPELTVSDAARERYRKIKGVCIERAKSEIALAKDDIIIRELERQRIKEADDLKKATAAEEMDHLETDPAINELVLQATKKYAETMRKEITASVEAKLTAKFKKSLSMGSQDSKPAPATLKPKADPSKDRKSSGSKTDVPKATRKRGKGKKKAKSSGDGGGKNQQATSTKVQAPKNGSGGPGKGPRKN